MAKSLLPGFPVSLSDSRTATAFVNDSTAVPADSPMLDGCAFTAAGSAYVCTYPAGGTANQNVRFIAGKAIRGDGAQIINAAGVIAQSMDGVGYTALGEMVANTSAPVRFPNGIGTSETGVASLNNVS